MQIKYRNSASVALVLVLSFSLVGRGNIFAALPTIGAIPDQTVTEDEPTDPVQLVLNDPDGTTAANMQLTGFSSDQAVVPNGNIFFGLAAGNRYITVTPAFGHESGAATITVIATDSQSESATNFFNLVVEPPPQGSARFYNPSPITIPSAAGSATPYPSQINVAGRVGGITNITLTLSGFSHALVTNVNILLVGPTPTGPGVVAMSHICGGNRGATNVTVHLTDLATYDLPVDFALWPEPLRPTTYFPPTFPGIPAGVAYGALPFSTFNGLSANGTWSLYVYDDAVSPAGGTIAGGWSLMIATSGGGSSTPTISDIADQLTTTNTATAAIAFTIGDPDTAVSNLVLSAGSSNPTLVPTNNIVFGGSASNRTVTVTPASGQTGTSTITVTVSDGTNSANDTFVLTVSAANTAPIISGITNQTINEDTSTGPIAFTVEDAETAAGSLTLGKGSSDAVLVPTNNIVFGGSGTNRTVTVTPAANLSGTATITVSVSDGLLSTNTSFVVTVNGVNDPPTISDIPNQSTAVDTATGVIAFTVGDVETSAGSLTLNGDSSNPTLVPTNNIVFGGSGSNRTVTVTPAAGQTGTSTITVSVSDGINSANDTFVLTVSSVSTVTGSFTNAAAITIPTTGAASPYPSTIAVSGVTGMITNVTVTLYGLSHEWSRDPGVILVGPAGQTVVLFTGIGAGGGMSDLTLTFSDAAASFIPFNATVTNGTYKGADYEWSNTNGYVDPFFPGPAPARPAGAPYTNQLSSFNGLAANGTWSLYVADGSGAALSQGSIANGWSLTVTTVSSGPQPPTISDIADQFTTLDTPTAAIGFTIGDPDTAVSNLVLSAGSSNPTLVPTNNIVFGGSASNRTVTVTPASGQTGTSTITVSVSDGTNSANDTFVLTVNAANTAPIISGITNQTINEDTSTGPIAFTVEDAETAAGSLTLGKGSSDAVLVPTNNIVFGGSGTNRTVTVTPAANLSGTATITVSVSDGLLSTNTSFVVTVNGVNDPPTISDIPNQSTAVDTATGVIAFTVGDVETSAGSLTLNGDSSNPTLVPTNNIVFGGSGSNRTVTVTPAAGQTGTSTITVSVSDGINSANDTFVLTVSSVSTVTGSFTNAAAITIPTTGAASPYPSTIAVSGVTGMITNVTVTLYGLSHEWSRDPGVILVGPAGQTVVLFTGIGAGGGMSDLTLTFSDAAASFIPFNATVTNGTYKGADYEWSNTNGYVDPFFPGPAPARPAGAPYTNQLSSFNGLAANGTWSLYVADGSGAALSQGSIANGWSLTVTTVSSGPQPPTISDIADQFTTLDTPTAAIGFTIGDPDTAVSNLVLSAGSSNPTLVPTNNIVFGGSASNRTVTVTPASGQTGTSTITVSVSDGTNSANDTFVLTVNAANTAPIISGITNQTINEDTSTGPIAFTVEDAETAAGSLTLGKGSSDAVLVPTNNIVFGGSGTNRTVTVTPAANLSGTATITVSVSDGLLSTNTSFVVTVNGVNDPPTISDIPNQSTAVDTATGVIAFTVGDVETSAGSLTLNGDSSNPTLVPTNNIVFGGSGSNRTVTVTPAAGQTGTSTITVSVSDGINSANDTFVLTVSSVSTVTGSFTNAAAITIPTTGAASPYPSTIAVSGVTGMITNVTVTLYGLSHEWSRDPGVILVGPAGQTVVLFTGIGAGGGMSDLTLTFSDAAASFIPFNATVTNGTYKGADYEWSNTNGYVDPFFPGPAPARPAGAPYTNQLSSFNGLAANGTWSLYVADGSGAALSQGSIANGWSLTIATIPTGLPPTISGISNQLTTLGTPTPAIAFTIDDADTPLSNLVLTASSSNTNLVSVANIVFSGSGTNRAVTVTPSPNHLGTTTITVGVADDTGNLGSTSFVLTVEPGQLTVTANNTNKVYGSTLTLNGTDFALTGTLIGGDTLTNVNLSSAGTGAGAAVGTYAITATNAQGVGLTNYVITYIDGVLTVRPAAVNQSVTTPEDTSTNLVLGNGGIVDPVFAILTEPSHGARGVLNTTNGTVSYTPSANYNGPDSFQFTVSNGSFGSTGTVSITVVSVNDGPVANSQSVTNAEDTSFAITLSGSDVDGPLTNYVVVTQPINGTLSGVAPNLTYRGSTNYLGPDSFTFTRNDGTLTSAVATVTITLTNINDAPLANSQSLTNAEDTSFAITLSGSDVDGPLTNYVVVTQPINGTLSGVAPNLTYRGSTNYLGPDSFTFTRNDGTLTSAVATVTITLTNINDAPLANSQSLTNAEDTSFAITLSGSDVDGPLTNYTVVAQPINGTLSGVAPNLTYRGSTNYLGPDSFTFTRNDGTLTSAVATVTITLTNINDGPVANSQSLTNAEDTSFAITLSGSDVDGPLTNYVVVTQPINGTLSGVAPNLTYRGSTNYLGPDSFTFTRDDGTLTSAVATVTITLTNINDAPLANSQSLTNAEDTSFAITLSGSDVDGPLTNYTVVAQPINGTLSGVAPNLTYRGSTNYLGPDSFTFTRDDGTLTSAVATVTITLTNINDAPLANSQSLTNAEDTSFAITLSGSDVDGPLTNYVVVTQPINGTLSGVAPNLTYRGSTNYLGPDSFTFTRDDGTLTSAVATVTITLTNINDGPVANSQSLTNAEDTSFAITLSGSDVDGPLTNYVVVTQPINGTLSGVAPNLTYRGSTNYLGPDSFTFTRDDGTLTSAVATVTITLTNINDAPLANSQSLTNAEDTSFAITLSGSDVDGPLTNYTVVAQPINGTLSGVAPNLTYRGSTNYLGPDSFTFTRNDGTLTSAVATVTITLTNINDAPLANSQSLTNAEDTSFAITLSGSDVDGPLTNYVVVTQPINGTLSGVAPNLTYRGSTNYLGPDSFTFTRDDGTLTSAVATVTITLTNINDAPLANSQSLTNAEDTSFAITLSGSDVDGPLTNYTVVAQPINGTLSGVAPNLTYRGSTNYLGPDSFTFTRNDGTLTSAVATVTITLTNINDAPLANSQSLTNAEDTSFAITLSGSDVDGPLTNYVVVTQPINGTLSGVAPNLTYRGSTNYLGPDSFTFTRDDGTLTSSVATVTITLTNINDAPLANSQSLTNAEDTSFAITLSGSDVDGPLTNYVVVAQPINGTLSGVAPNLTYRGSTNYLGPDSFTFTRDDGTLTSAVATVTITLTNINDAPLANSQSLTNAEDTSFAITLSGSDVDGPLTNYVVVTQPINGTLSGVAPNLTYRGSTNYLGPDSFTFTRNDGTLTSAVATVTITLTNINDAPLANSQSLTNAEDTSFAITLSGSDVDGPLTNYVVVTQPINGTLSGVAPNLTYRGSTNYLGPDSFTFTRNDGTLTSAVATVTITLTNINDAPLANSQSLTNAEDTSFAITLSGSDVDGPLTNYVVVTQPINGTLSGVAPNLTYRGSTNYLGPDSFTFTRNDGTLTSAVATVTITLTNINDAPLANSQSLTNAEDTSFAITLSGSDVDGPLTNYVVVAQPINGTLSGVAPNLTYRGSTNYLGPDSFTFTRDDGTLTSSVATVTITLTNINDAPLANSQSLTNAEDTSFAITLSGSDVDGPLTNYVVVTQPINGTLSGVAPNLTYRGSTNYLGPDSFTFTRDDGTLTSAVATVTITLTNINDAPLANSQSLTNAEDTSFAITLSGSDVDGPLTNYVVVTQPINGTLSGVAPNLTYRGSTNYLGPDSFTFTRDDGTLTSSVATVTITLTNINDAPLANSQSLTNAEDTSFAITLSGSDVDGPLTNYVVVTQPINGTLSGVAPNLTYRGSTNYLGPDSFTFTRDDGTLTSAVATVTITLTNINDAPLANSQSLTNAEDTSFAITLSGSDVDGPLTNYVVVTQPINGTLSGVAPNLTYRGSTNYLGPDSFTFTRDDGTLTSSVATVTITLTNINDAPLANSQSLTNAEDTSFAITLSGSDVDGPLTNYVVVTQPINGTLSGVAPNLTYRGSTNYLGPDSFTFTRDDGTLTSSVATVTITLTNINDAPLANSQSVTNAEDTSFAITLSGSDVDGPLTNYVVVTQPINGTLSGVAPNLTYRGSTNYLGPDSFTFTRDDGTLTSSVATVTITLTNINDAPLANSQSLTNAEDTSFAITLSGSDVDGPLTNYVVVTQPINGTLSGVAPNLTYRGSTNYLGPDSFTFTRDDGTLTSSVATVTITLTNINDAPLANSQSLTNAEDTSFAITLSGSDVDGPLTNYVVVAQPINGTLSGVAPNLTYRGSTNYLGPDSFTFTRDDGTLTSAVATVTITLTNINDAPLANSQSLTNAEDTSFAITLSGSDVDGPLTNYVVVTQPINGTLSGVAPNLTYRGSTNYLGPDSFTFTRNDGTLTSAVATVTITLTNINDAPLANSQSLTNAEDTSFAITLSGSDVDGPLTNYVVVTQPINGTLSGVAPNLTYRGSTNYLGPDSFTFTRNDGTLTSAVATVTITLTNINDAPLLTLASNNVMVLEDSGLITVTNFALATAGPANESNQVITNIAVLSVSNASLFAVSPVISTNGTLTFMAAANSNGVAAVTVQVRDNGGTAGGGTNGSVASTFNITVTGVNDAPVLTFASNNVVVLEDCGMVILTNFALATTGPANESGQSIRNIVVTGVSNAELFVVSPAISTNGTLTFNAAANNFGVATVEVQARDNGGTANGGTNGSFAQVFAITVMPVNDAPVAQDDGYDMTVGTTLVVGTPGVLANDSDVDSVNLSAILVSGPAHGTLSLSSNGGFNYTPVNYYVGSDSFTYRASDGLTNSTVATMTVAVSYQLRILSITTSNSMATVTWASISNQAYRLQYKDGLEGTNWTDVTPGVLASGPITSMTNAVGSSLKRFYRVQLAALQPIHNGPSLPSQADRSVNELSVLSVTNTAMDTDIPLLPLTYSLAVTNLADNSAVTNAAIDANGIITWTPTEAQGPRTNRMTTIVSDGSLKATNTFLVVVNEVNSAPTAVYQALTTQEDTATNVVFTTIDADIPANVFTYAILTGTTNGALSNFNPSNGTVTYTSSSNFNGPDYFRFTTSDGSLISTGGVSIAVVAVNDAPVAQDDGYDMTVGTTLVVGTPGVLANDSDVDSVNLSAILVSGPAHGTLSLSSNGGFNYTPVNYYVGSDSFTYRASDGLTNSTVATMTVAVSYQLRILSITTSNSMATVTWASISNQAYRLQYKDGLEGTNWTDVTPGVLASGPITSMTNAVGSSLKRFYRVQLAALQPIHNGPSLPSQADRSVNELSVLSVTNTAMDTDIPLLPLTYSLAVTNLADNSAVTNAAIDANGIITWTPTEAQGPRTNRMTTIVSDGSLKATNTFLVVVNEVNSAPTAVYQALTTQEDTATNVVFTTIDADIPANVFTYAILTGTTNGALSNFNPSNGTVTYTSSSNFNGPDYFRFTTSDGSLISTGGVSIAVVAVNDAPVAQDDGYDMTVGTTLVVGTPGVLANDSDVDSVNLSAILVSGPAHGTLSLSSNGGFNYTPVNYYVGSDSFTYRASDGLTNSTVATMTVAVSYQLRILSITTSNSMATVTWASISNQAYRLQYKDGLEGTNWTDVTPGVLASGPITSMTNAVGSSLKRFYRVQLAALQPIHNGPSLPSQADRSVNELSVLSVTNTAMDTDIPLLPLTYSLAVTNLADNSVVTNAAIDAKGIITWTPTEAQGPSTNRMTTIVSDGSLKATNTFLVVVNEVNSAPTLPEQTEQTVKIGTLMMVTNTASDEDLPVNSLTYSLTVVNLADGSEVANAAINTNGRITWTPVQGQGHSTNIFTTVVTDNGVPVLRATNTFNVIVPRLGGLSASDTLYVFQITSITVSNGVAVIGWDSIGGEVYRLQYKDNLADTTWNDVGPDVAASGPTVATTNVVGDLPQRFYRVFLPSP